MMRKNAQRKTAMNAAHSCATLMLCVFILITTPKAYAQDITTGLVNHWKMDETSTTTTTDEGSTPYNGAMLGGLSGGDSVNGIINGGLQFDGADDYIDFDPQQVIDTVPLTYAGWIYFDAFTDGNYTPIFMTSYFNSGVFCGTQIASLGSAGGTTGGLSVINGTCGGGGPVHRYTSDFGTPFETGRWYHIIASVNDYNDVTVYVDGQQLTQTGQSGTATRMGFSNSTRTRIGFPTTGDTLYFDGAMDDIRLYDRLLTAADVTELYISTRDNYVCTSPGAPTGAIIYNEDENVMQLCNGTDWTAIGKPPSSDTASGLIGHWKLDETSGTTVTDSSTSGINGTMREGLDASTDATNGPKSGALSFDGVEDFVSIPDIFGAETGLTYAGWFKTPDWSNGSSISTVISHVKDTGSDTIANFDYINGISSLLFQVRNASDVNVSASISSPPINEWVHIAGTYDGANVKMYLNGVEQGSNPQTGPLFDSSNIIALGSKWQSGIYPTGSSPFAYQGEMDDVRIYNRALSEADIQDLFDLSANCPAPTDNLVGHWKLNDTTGSTIVDSAGSNTGTWTDGTGNSVAEETTTGQDGTAITFDGINDEIDLGNDASLNLTTPQTIAAWVKSSTDVTFIFGMSIVERGYYGDPRNTLSLKVHRVGDVANFSYEYGSGTNSLGALGTTDITDGNWHHIVGQWDGVDCKVFVNGIFEGSASCPNTPGPFDQGFTIGKSKHVTDSEYFNGQIDDVRIYDTALTADEITRLYGGTGGACTADPSCSAPYAPERSILYNNSDNVMQYCNGEDWVAMGPAGNGGGGCSAPTGAAGDMVYNETFNVLQYCEGDEWVATGPSNLVMPTTDLVAHWKLDETSGAALADNSGNSNTATTRNGFTAASSTSGKDGAALNFNGSTDYFDAPDFLGSETSLTVSAWVRPDNWSTGGAFDFIFSKTDTITELISLAQRAASSQIVFRVLNTSDVLAQASAPQPATGTWTHITGTYDGSRLRLYYNGIEQHSATATGSVKDTNTAIVVGRKADLSAGTSFDGRIDDLRVYTRALSAAEVNSLYHGTDN